MNASLFLTYSVNESVTQLIGPVLEFPHVLLLYQNESVQTLRIPY